MEAVQEKKADLVIPDGARTAHRLPAVSADASSLMKIIDRAAMDPTFDVAKLEQLLKVRDQWEATEARKAFVAAMAAFKADPPAILKSKAVSIPGGAQFSHATLAAVCDGVVAALSRNGFSHKWEVAQQDRLITVTCIVTHELGHSERTVLSGAPDDSGKKNAIQQIGSTVTYLQRYTLMAAVGLAAKDMDNDGAGASAGSAKRLDEQVVVDHLTAIDSADTEESLMASFKTAWTAADNINDKGSRRLFTEHKDKRLKALRTKK